jgi:hypothetical protein
MAAAKSFGYRESMIAGVVIYNDDFVIRRGQGLLTKGLQSSSQKVSAVVSANYRTDRRVSRRFKMRGIQGSHPYPFL